MKKAQYLTHRNMARVLAFTSSEVLIDNELISLLGEKDRSDGTYRVDIYLVQQIGQITMDMYDSISHSHASKVAFFKAAIAQGLFCGASVKSDFGFGYRRASSGELHLERCPITFFAMPRINELAGSLSDVLVLVNISPRFTITGAGKIQYTGIKRERDGNGGSTPTICKLR